MQFIQDIAILKDMPSAVVIGKFDGMHLGHRKLISRALDERREGMQTVVFTFSVPTGKVLSGVPCGGQLITLEERRTLAAELGADVLVEFPFDDNTRRITAEDFYERILKDALHASVIVAGPDCSFGYMRRGNLDFLKKMEAEGGIRLVPVEKEQYKGEDISSTRIKKELALGHMEEVNAMLGYDFGFKAEIVHGNHMGHSLGFPTINQLPPAEKALPPFGVYAARVEVDGEMRFGVANVGVKPTIPGINRAGVETHILDFEKDVYGMTADVRLLHFVRPEMRFKSLSDLSEQIGKDKQAVLERNGLS